MPSAEQPEAATKRRSKGKKETAAARKPLPKKRAPSRSDVAEPSDEAIQLRAYFIAERRMRLAIPGDPSADWLEAKRQLLDEAAGPGEEK